MEPSSPPTDRVLRIVQLLTNRPFETFTLSDLVRHLGITRATGHAIVSTMTEGGHLVRHPITKTYSLGPAWVAVGRAAEQARPELAHAYAAIEKLANELFGMWPESGHLWSGSFPSQGKMFAQTSPRTNSSSLS